jgi:uncharacterized membrane protein YgcG
MSAPLLSRPRLSRPRLPKTKSRLKFVLFTAAACALLALPVLADSQARIVRLSDVQGSVQIDKNSGTGFENAFLNLPVTQGTQLRTRADGRAEVEFEDGSTLRVGPNTTIEFSTLGLSDAGKHISVINLADGMAYVNWLGKSGDDFTLNFSSEKVSLAQAAHIRVETSAHLAKLAVFKGDVEAEGPSGKVMVAKNKTATFDASDNDKYALANSIAEAPLDSWDRESIAYHDQYAKTNSNNSPYGYGLSDLNYYGGYYNVPGYGTMWQPYFTGVGWDPFMDGAWGWYPGMGYMFASAYPWGWLPYYYGNWAYVQPYGWMWQPGGWNTWNPVPVFKPTTLVQVHPLVAPTGSVNTVAVGKGGAISPSFSTRMVVHNGSAGLGIPRGSIENLGHLNHEVAKNGFAEVHPEPQFSASSARAGGFESSRGTAGSSTGHASSGGHSSGGGGHH